MNREDLIRAIAGEIDLNMPFVMVASERIANLVLEEAAKVARNACLVPPDGGAPTEEERLMCEQAADEIRALRARVAELEGALRPFAGKAVKWEANHPVRPGGYGHSHSTQVTHRLGDFRRARDVLDGADLKGASHEQG